LQHLSIKDNSTAPQNNRSVLAETISDWYTVTIKHNVLSFLHLSIGVIKS